MAGADNYLAIIAACEANILAAVTNAAAAGGLPNAAGGGQIDHDGYVKRQRDTIAWAREQISLAEGPYEITVQGIP